MSNLTKKQLLQERSELLREISSFSLLLHGSWLERFSTCSRAQCQCHKGKKHGPRYYLVVNDNNRQRQKYIPKKLEKTAQAGLSQYKRLQEIVNRITQINLTLMKEYNNESQ